MTKKGILHAERFFFWPCTKVFFYQEKKFWLYKKVILTIEKGICWPVYNRLYTYMHAYIHTYIHTYIHVLHWSGRSWSIICNATRMHTHAINTCKAAHTYTCKAAHTYTWTTPQCINEQSWSQPCVHIHTPKYTHMHKNKCMDTYPIRRHSNNICM